MTITLVNEKEIVKDIVQAIGGNKISIAAQKLRQQAENPCELSASWLLKTAEALETNDWSILSEDFINLSFISKNGYFLMIAPYRINRQGQRQEILSAICRME
ncbi:DUF6014 family protein [Aphanothece sacrum]|uniref:McnG protein n=1 Tax=Aphanothece sacrum FPU1 TaxID=1920663 RepID=A0A401IKG4_APHSA|nr:DUF6014 family protein [Aphanothece sacrum]GBF81611.1 McnG protein [Aphanothece sacrum FPU1]GBF84131.1 McnG protein [Aphanothece sacrum FPU3]